jgi:hypothetical protein
MFSSVAQFAIELFKQEMALEEPVTDGMPIMMTYQPMQRTTVEGSVQRSCDGAEKLYTEMLRRGWVQEMPPLDECIERRLLELRHARRGSPWQGSGRLSYTPSPTPPCG